MTDSPQPQSFAAAYARWVMHRRWYVIAGSLLIFVLCAGGLSQLIFNDNYRAFFADDNPHLRALEKLEDTYAREEVMLIVLAPEDGDVFSRASLSAVAEMTENAWDIPLSSRVDSIANFQHSRADGDDIVIEELAEDPTSMTDEELAYVRRTALSEPLLVDRLVSPEGDVTAVAVTFVLPGLATGERTEPVTYARELAKRFSEEHPGVKVIVNGGIVLSYAFTEYSQRDTATLTPLQFLVVFVMMALFLRSIPATICAVVVVILSVVSAMGLSGWLGLEMTAPAAAMPTIVLSLAVADSVHLLVHLLGDMRAGSEKRAALAESLRINFSPILLTSVTTCVGFLSMNLNSVPPLQDFGNMNAMGVAAAFFYSIGLLPAMVAVLPFSVRGRDQRKSLSGVAEFVISQRRPLLLVGASLAVLVGGFSLRNEFTNNWVNWFDDSTAFRQDIEYIEDHLSGINAIEFSIPAEGPNGVAHPEYLRTLDAFATWLEQEPEVSHVGTLADVLKQVNRSMHGDDAAYYTIPDSPELASQYLLLYEMSLPYGQDLNNQINIDKSATRLTIITAQIDSDALHRLSTAAEAWLVENAPTYMHTTATGNGPMFASIAEDTIRSMVFSIPAALLCVSLALILAFRSLGYGVLSVVPNLVPILMAYGVWGILVGRINFGVACVAGLGIGIVVDDTVHFMSKYLRARREHGMGPEDAVRFAFERVGRAMWSTSMVLIAGFLVLSLSSFNFNASMGLLGAIAVGIALVADILLLPALLLSVDRTGSADVSGTSEAA